MLVSIAASQSKAAKQNTLRLVRDAADLISNRATTPIIVV
jgi:hypothetical protein